jgi:protein O-GlcNAc transferase
MNRKQRRAEEKLGRDRPAMVLDARAMPLFAHAVACHQAGRLADAESHYRQVLAIDPDHAETHHYLGILASQVGRGDIAIAMIAKAIALKGLEPSFHDSLGNAFKSRAGSMKRRPRTGGRLPCGPTFSKRMSISAMC